LPLEDLASRRGVNHRWHIRTKVKTMAKTDYKKMKKADLIAALEALDQQPAPLAPQELALSEAKYRALVEGSSDFIYVLDREGQFTYANQESSHLLGYSPQDIIGKHFSEVLHPKDVEALKYTFQERRTGERATKRLEVRLRSRSGDTRDVEMDIRHFSLTASGLYSGEDYVGTHGVARDITERKYQESKRRALQQVREAVWGMLNADDIQQVLEAIRSRLETMGIPFHHCSVHILDMGEPPMLYSYTSQDSSSITSSFRLRICCMVR